MTILLDPSRDGCTIWFLNYATVKYIHGYPVGICKRIFDFCTYEALQGEIIQAVDIILDTKGIGQVYEDVLQREYNLKVIKVKPELNLQI
jgi:hypothetical protein